MWGQVLCFTPHKPQKGLGPRMHPDNIFLGMEFGESETFASSELPYKVDNPNIRIRRGRAGPLVLAPHFSTHIVHIRYALRGKYPVVGTRPIWFPVKRGRATPRGKLRLLLCCFKLLVLSLGSNLST